MQEIFSFLIIRNSGHLLPMDLPEIALAMMRRFLHQQSFADQMLPSEAYYMDQVHMKLNEQQNERFLFGMSHFLLLSAGLVCLGFGYFYCQRGGGQKR